MFDTPILDRLSDEIKDGLAAQVPQPVAARPAAPSSPGWRKHIIDNPYLNGETIRLDGAIRMSPR